MGSSLTPERLAEMKDYFLHREERITDVYGARSNGQELIRAVESAWAHLAELTAERDRLKEEVAAQTELLEAFKEMRLRQIEFSGRLDDPTPSQPRLTACLAMRNAQDIVDTLLATLPAQEDL